MEYPDTHRAGVSVSGKSAALTTALITGSPATPSR